PPPPRTEAPVNTDRPTLSNGTRSLASAPDTNGKRARHGAEIPDPVAQERVLFPEGHVVEGRCIKQRKIHRFARPVLELTFRLAEEDAGALMQTSRGPTIVWFLSMENAGSPASKFFRAWAYANGGPPRRGDRMSPEKFLRKILLLVTHVSK